MKTLNKTLSLVLVLVMVLGVFGVASAKEFTDADAVTYTEAVDVMIGIGVIDGYDEDNTIRPTATVTREEAAKMIAYAVLGKNVADNLATGATGFTDVSANRWSAPYISYLVGRGIINGMGDGTFAPTANVTGYQFAKMMLCAAGYGAKGEYTSSSWQLNVAVDANKNGVFDDAVGVNYAAPATREESMLYAFNGITNVNQVVYNNVFGGYVAKNSITGPISASPTIADDLYGGKLVPEYAKDPTTGKILISAAGVLTGGEDAFGRPADTWEFKGENITVATLEPTILYTKDMTGATDKAAAEKTLSKYSINPNAKIVYNDFTVTAPATVANIIDATGNGTEVAIYANGSEIVRVAVITQNLDKVVYLDTVKEEVVLESGRRTSKGYGTVAVGDLVVTAYKQSDSTTVASLVKATTVKGVASTKSTYYKTITVDGKAYGIAAACEAGYGLAEFTVSTKGDATLILDQYGYVLKAESYGNAAADVIAVTDVYAALDGSKIVQMVEGKNSNGETVEYVWDEVGLAPAKGAIVEAQTGATSGTYTFATPTTDATKFIYVSSPDTAIGASDRRATAANNFYYASDVKFIFASTDADDDGDNSLGTDGKVTVFDGVQETKVAAAASLDSDTAYYITKTVGNTEEVVAVFYDGKAKNTANVSSDLVFLAAVDGTIYQDGKTYYNYIAVQNGAPIANCVGYAAGDVAWTSGATSYTTGQFYTVSKNDKGIYTFDSFTETTGSLRVLPASVVTTLNGAKTAIATVVPTATAPYYAIQPTISTGSATMINLDTKSMTSGGAISTAVADLIAIMKDSSVTASTKVGVPMIASIYNDKGTASMVYFFVKQDTFTKAQAAALLAAGGAITTAEYGAAISH